MEEKVLIKSEQYSFKKVFIIMAIVGLVISLIMFFVAVADKSEIYDHYKSTYLKHGGYCGDNYEWFERCWGCETIMEHPTKIGYGISEAFDDEDTIVCIIPVVSLSLLAALGYLWLRSYKLTVTDKRIYGKVAWGKRVDLPVDSVSATSTISLFKGVTVSTSSGRISFLAIKNADEIYTLINKLMIERQQEKVKGAATVTVTAPTVDETEQLKKYKELLDSGIITQEEFEAKKKQIMNL